jgi:tellurite resistance protein TerC
LEPTLWHWIALTVFVVALLVIDLTVFHRGSHEPTLRQSAAWSLAWVLLALAFNGLIWAWARFDPPADGRNPALEFLTGYLIEKSLSVDNVFVFAVIFAYFRVPLKYQYRVLFWGILGALVMRLVFILAGVALIQQFEFVLAILGAVLLVSALKLAIGHDSDVNPEKNLLLRLGRKILPISRQSHGERFFIVENGRRCVTPLFLVLLVVESTDVMFAIDSVPAIFAITKDPFIIWSSNVFAILGLRALYFLLAGVLDMFRYLHYGLAGILGFVGLKMIGEYAAHRSGWIEQQEHLVPHWVSLAVIALLLASSIGASLIVRRRTAARSQPAPGLEPSPASDTSPSGGNPVTVEPRP